MEALLTKERAGRVAGTEGLRGAEASRTRGKGGTEEREIFDYALSGVRERVSIYAPPFRRKVLKAALDETANTAAHAEELIGMEGRVLEILARLPVKARAAFETVLRVYTLEGMEEGIDWGSAIVNETWKNLRAIEQARRELPDDPDVQVLERVCRLACAIDGGDFPAIEPGLPESAAAATVEDMDTMEAIDALNAMEPEIRALIAGLDVRTRAIVGMLSRLFAIESHVGGCGFTEDLWNEVLADEQAIERGSDLPNDGVIKVLCRAHELVRRLEDLPAGDVTGTDDAVTRGARELLRQFRQYLPSRTLELIEGLKGIEDQIAALDSPEGEAACMAALKPLRDPELHDREAKGILDVFRKYPEDLRGSILSATLAQARAAARAATKLGQMEASFGAALEHLDERTKAVLRIVSTMNNVDGNISSRFYDTWQRAVAAAPVDVLRSRPECAELLAVYDHACLLDEVTQ